MRKKEIEEIKIVSLKKLWKMGGKYLKLKIRAIKEKLRDGLFLKDMFKKKEKFYQIPYSFQIKQN